MATPAPLIGVWGDSRKRRQVTGVVGQQEPARGRRQGQRKFRLQQVPQWSSADLRQRGEGRFRWWPKRCLSPQEQHSNESEYRYQPKRPPTIPPTPPARAPGPQPAPAARSPAAQETLNVASGPADVMLAVYRPLYRTGRKRCLAHSSQYADWV